MELRQHVWKRNGVVVWIGAGTVFNKFSALRMDRVLPNYGIGYRWEFKKNVNVRLDYGFGKNEMCIRDSFRLRLSWIILPLNKRYWIIAKP